MGFLIEEQSVSSHALLNVASNSNCLTYTVNTFLLPAPASERDAQPTGKRHEPTLPPSNGAVIWSPLFRFSCDTALWYVVWMLQAIVT
eukprot:6478123-Amphidinium_carterae.1